MELECLLYLLVSQQQCCIHDLNSGPLGVGMVDAVFPPPSVYGAAPLLLACAVYTPTHTSHPEPGQSQHGACLCPSCQY